MDAVNKKYEGSISQTTPVWKNEKNEIAERPSNYKDNTTLSMDDFYALMAAEMQYQDVLNPESNTSEMMNQMVQMSMINAIQDMMTMSMTTYAGSLMGKEVMIADSSTGKMETIYGVVEGVNLYNGTPTIIVNGKEYSMAQIMGLGKAPETSKPDEKPPVTEDGDEEKPPVTGGDEEKPPVTGGDEEKPPVTGGDEEKPPVTGGEGNGGQNPPVTEGNGNEQPTPPVTEGSGNEQPTPPVTEGNGNEEQTPPVTEGSGNEQPTPPVTEGSGNEEQTPPVTEDNGSGEQNPPTTEGDGGEQA